MSLSVTCRKSRRKLHHMAKNLDDVLYPTSFVSNNVKSNSSDCRINSKSRRGFKPQTHSDSSPASFSNSSSSFSTFPFSVSRSRHRKNISLDKEMKRISANGDNDIDLELISFRIGSITYEMDDKGNWNCLPKNSLVLKKGTIAELAERSTMLAQENNMLRVKNELLTDMIARKKVHKEKIEKELDRLRKLLSTSSSRFSNTDSAQEKK